MRKFIISALLLTMLVYGASLVSDLAVLQDSLIRLHVVGASDSEADQGVKLLVKDAVASYLEERLADAETREQAQQILNRELTNLEELANRVLAEQGFSDTVRVSLGEEEFPRRDYDTFSLPAGVYESLRIQIGQAEGRNWWCVVFPSLCIGAVQSDVQDTAAGAGFSGALTGTITGEEEYELRFFLLDCLGELQNFFHKE